MSIISQFRKNVRKDCVKIAYNLRKDALPDALYLPNVVYPRTRRTRRRATVRRPTFRVGSARGEAFGCPCTLLLVGLGSVSD